MATGIVKRSTYLTSEARNSKLHRSWLSFQGSRCTIPRCRRRAVHRQTVL